MIFDLQRFVDIKTVNQASVLSSAEVAAGKDSLGNNITSYVKTVEPGDSGLTITQGDNSTYSVTLQSGLDGDGNTITTSYLRKNTNDTLSGSVTITGAASIGSSLSVTGGLRLKGSNNYGNKLNFGDGDYVYLQEPSDDNLLIKAKQISLTSSTANKVFINGTNVTALGGNADLSTVTVAAADKLTSSKSLKVSLGSSDGATFDGSADVTLIGVGGTLPVSNGGTGQTVLSAVTVGKASSLENTKSLKVSLASSAAQTFNGGADATLIGVGGVLPVSNGGTGSSTGIATFSTSANGLVPKPSSASATLFLTAAGTWATAGGGTSSGSPVLTTTSSTVNGAMWLA